MGIAYAGLVVFNMGLNYGLATLGDLVGAIVPSLFHKLAKVPGSPLMSRSLGIVATVVFTFFLGLCATLAEPALNAMGRTTEKLTKGAFRKSTVMVSVAVGVASGVMLGILRMIVRWPLHWMLGFGYTTAMVMTIPCGDMYVCVAWDAAGVTTGSITVPLVLAMGLGLGEQLQVHDAFGVLSMASIGPIISVLAVGLWIENRDRILVRFPFIGRFIGDKSGFRYALVTATDSSGKATVYERRTSKSGIVIYKQTTESDNVSFSVAAPSPRASSSSSSKVKKQGGGLAAQEARMPAVQEQQVAAESAADLHGSV